MEISIIELIRREKISRAMKGRISPMKGRKQSEKAKELMRRASLGRKLSESAKLKVSLARRGKNHWNWKGGISPIDKRIRRSARYRDWRTSVFERDNYTCQDCGQRGGRLNADHIKPFAYFTELRFLIGNGRTLCVECHTKTDTWGQKARNLYEVKR